MKIIDAHNHPDWHGHDFQKFIANMDACGIDKTWILNWECPDNEYGLSWRELVSDELMDTGKGPIPFSRCLAYKEKAPDRFVLGYCPDPRLPDACARLKASHEIYGAEVCGELKCRMMYDNSDALKLFYLAGHLKMPVVFHLQHRFQKTWDSPREEWWGGDIHTLGRVLGECPDTLFLGHGPGFWIHISADDLHVDSTYPPPGTPVEKGGALINLLEEFPNLYCDMSSYSGHKALARDPEFTREFLIKFQDRVVYARDYFDNVHQELINSLRLPDEVLNKIYHLNAEAIIGNKKNV